MSATLSFHGAAGVVTGSCYRLQLANRSILIDCGMFQGDKTLKELNYSTWPFDPRQIDAVLLTHAHIDHSGLIPKLVKAGFRGPVMTTEGSADLLRYMLPDSGGIQEMEVERLNRRNQRRGRGIVQPIYTEQDAVDSLKQIAKRDFETHTAADRPAGRMAGWQRHRRPRCLGPLSLHPAQPSAVIPGGLHGAHHHDEPEPAG